MSGTPEADGTPGDAPGSDVVKLACIGEAMIELSLDDDGTGAAVGYAGDTLNTAVYLKRAGQGALDVSYVTRLGRDGFSDRMVAFMQAQGVGTDHVGRSQTRKPGLYAIETDAQGERQFTYWRDQSAARGLFRDRAEISALAAFDVLYLSAITLAILDPDVRDDLLDWLADFRDAGGEVAFDSNFRPALWPDIQTARDVVARMWTLTDIALPSLDDEAALFGEADPKETLERLSAHDFVAGALKRGALGPVSLTAGAAQTFKPAPKVVDTTAAGDSFNAGFLAAYLQGNTEAQAMAAGHALATRVVAHRGAIIDQ